MQAFADSDILPRSVLIHSFTKSHTLSGDRFGWVAFGDPGLALAVSSSWVNGAATLPGEWQLRFMAYVQLFTANPDLEETIRSLYTHRRAKLVDQLQRINAEEGIFESIYGGDAATIYVWARLCPGEDVFSVFSKTGIAGVPGGAFGYSDDYVRFSLGCVPVASW